MSKDSNIPNLTNLPETGLLRIKQVLQFIPVSRSSWWQGVRTGKYPKPIKLGERTTCWKSEDVRSLINGGCSHDRK